VHRDPKAFARPFRRDVDVVIDVQACVFDAVAHQLGDEDLGVFKDVGRDRERPEGPSHLGQGPEPALTCRSRRHWGTVIRDTSLASTIKAYPTGENPHAVVHCHLSVGRL
jgi:hypothetical protein